MTKTRVLGLLYGFPTVGQDRGLAETFLFGTSLKRKYFKLGSGLKIGANGARVARA